MKKNERGAGNLHGHPRPDLFANHYPQTTNHFLSVTVNSTGFDSARFAGV